MNKGSRHLRWDEEAQNDAAAPGIWGKAMLR